jgi:hypothetical protein
MFALVVSVSGFGTAFAQTAVGTGMAPPVGITSPLGIGPGAPVAATGIPLGATELATPGVSPTTSGISSLGSMTTGSMGTATACSGTQGSMQTGATGLGSSTVGTGTPMSGESSATGAVSGTSAPTPLFDGAGIAGTASGTCANGIASSSPTGSASSPTMGSGSTAGRVGIPLGSTELNTGGVSPLPDITTLTQAPITSTGTTPCPTTEMSTAPGTSTTSSGC